MIRDQIPLLLWGWAAVSPLLFRLIPGRDAAIACLVVGWAFLPVAPYPPSVVASAPAESSWQALAVPTDQLVNKATAIGLGCLAGLLLFDRRTLGRLRFEPFDLPMAAWCLIPLVSTAAAGLPVSEGLAQARYLGIAWGVPYLIGRAYLGDADSRRRFAVGIAAGGVAYLPICLLEIVAGPTAYRVLYGPHPYEFEGARRFLGSRPLGFMEHGNQLGIWMAGSAAAATWLWASGARERIGGLPGWAAAPLLVAATLLCQSHGSILLLGIATIPLLISRVDRRHLPWRWAVGVALAAGSLAVVLLAARRGFNVARLRDDLGGFFKGLDKSSFTWRLSRAEELLPMALRRPIVGAGLAGWRSDGRPLPNPVNLSLWLLALGMYGLVGLAALGSTWIVPPTRAIRRGLPRSWLEPAGAATGALACVAIVHAIDSLSNSTVVLPIIAALGGLNRPVAPSKTP